MFNRILCQGSFSAINISKMQAYQDNNSSKNI